MKNLSGTKKNVGNQTSSFLNVWQDVYINNEIYRKINEK